MVIIQLNFTTPDSTAVDLEEADADETENKYQRRKNATFLGKLIKAHEIHPKYKVRFVCFRLIHQYSI